MAATIRQKSRHEHLRDIERKYRRQHPDKIAIDLNDVAAFAIHRNLWEPRMRSARKQCAAELASALRESYETDKQERRVRASLPVRYTRKNADGDIEQYTLWADCTSAPKEHMHLALQQKRKIVVANAAQLKRDTDSWNENNRFGAFIQMSYDLTDDLFELEAPEEYPDRAVDSPRLPSASVPPSERSPNALEK